MGRLSAMSASVSNNSTPRKNIEEVSFIPDTASFQSDSTFRATPTKSIKRHTFGSPRFPSNSSLNSSISKSRRFDERLTSRFSDKAREAHTLDLHQDDEDNHEEANITSIKWVNLQKLNGSLHDGKAKTLYGDPTCIVPGDVVAIGTSKGYILIFDYHQNLLHSLGKNTKAMTCGSITSIAMSLDSTHVACGFESGDVFLWNIRASSKPLCHIQPLNDTNMHSDGHVAGSIVNNLTFVGKRHTVLISSDVNGLVFYHQCNRGVLGVTVGTRKILGRYEDIQLRRPTTVFGCTALPLGPSVELMDSQGLVAILSSSALVIISTSNNIKTQFKVGKPKVIDESVGKTGCLSWFPAFLHKNGVKSPAKLAYCWSNVLTVLEVTNYGEHLQFDSKKRWLCDEAILGVQWVSHSVIGLITTTQQLILINERTMKVSASIDLLSRHIYKNDIYSRMPTHSTLTNNFNSSYRIYKGKMFIVGKYEIFIGSTPNWMDVLYEQVNRGQYIEAIEKARKFYAGVGDLDVVGLPREFTDRQKIVLRYLVDIVKASATHILTPERLNNEEDTVVKDFLYTSIKALISIHADSVVYEDFYETFKLNNHVDYFFESLEPFILSGLITSLSPIVLKDMVAYYSSAGKTEVLEQLICLLDIKSLDIDFTISLLQKNNLRDSFIFIWNNLLNDYITPFVDFVKDIQEGKEDSYKVFSYLAYILTGRQYPTENLIQDSRAYEAKLSLYYVLFNGMAITWPKQGGSLVEVKSENNEEFPYLLLLLRFDSSSFLSALNECFEDSLLNDDEIIHEDFKLKVNRQFIIEILIEIYNRNEFSFEDQLSLSIFIARNYPKFQQFIRLSESVLESSIQTLCSYEGDDLKEDCELSLQSLLSVYQPSNRDELLSTFQNAGFTDVLMNLYLNDQKYADVLSLWLKSNKSNSIETTDDILERCFRSTENKPKERANVEKVVNDNFPDLIEANTHKIVKILNIHSPKSHKLVLKLDDLHLKHLYLSSLSNLEENGQFKMSKEERDEYIGTLAKFDKKELESYVKSLSLSDFDFEKCVDSLKENEAVDTLVYLYKQQDRYEDALSEVLDYMQKLVNSLSTLQADYEKGKLQSVESKLWKYLLLGINISNHEGSTTQTRVSTELSVNENMWLSLINFTVNLFKKFDKDGTSSKVLDIIKRLVQDLFTSLINTRAQISSFKVNESGVNEHQSSFLKIFAKFLESSSVHVTLLGDVRSVTNEIYLAFSYEKNILTITSKLINEGIYQNMQKLTDKNLAGWSVLNFECDACGKTIWGRGIEAEAYCKWEDRQRGKTIEDGDVYDLVSFSCRHCYHKRCLENLGVKENLTCVICDNEK